MKKKVLKIVGIVLVVIIGLLVAAPFLLKGKIAEIIKNKVNNSITATFDFKEADLSLFRNFPNASLQMKGISLINKAPFEGDTLFAADELSLNMSIMELFKDASEPIQIKDLGVHKATLNILVDEAANANYDIAVPSENENTAAEDTSSDTGFTMDLQTYEITDSKIVYHDAGAGMMLILDKMNHSGKGDLSLETSELDTKTNAEVSFVMDSTNYLNKNTVQLDALIGIDLKNSKYSFLKNEALINQLPLVFDGFVQVNENNQEVDISFKTPSSDFKNFLAVIPEVYSKNIENVQTTGNFVVAGEFTGIVDETHIPKFTIGISSENASFKYPDLPKSVSNIHIDTEIANTTGIVEDTYVDIRKLSFMIDQDKFNMVANIKDLMGNTKVDAHVTGNMNLANLSKAYPVPAEYNLKGMLNADVAAAFDMATLEKKQYQNTKINGQLSLKNFEYASEEMANPVQLKNTSVTFNPQKVTLNELSGTTGKTDFNANGSIQNFLGYMFNNENIEGVFNLKSNMFSLNDFMVEEQPVTEEKTAKGSETTESTTPVEEKIKIPSFLDCTINASAATVVYDNLSLKNVSGTLTIKDEKATLSNMTSSIFDGKLAFNGEVSTKQDTPTFAMNLDMSNFQISETFKALDLFKAVAPIANIIQGKLNSDIKLSGNLNNDFTPILASLSGDILASLLSPEVTSEDSKLLTALDGKLNFIDFKQLNLKDLKTSLSFENGTVKVKPFTLKYKDIAINVAGSHGFDKNLNYAATIDVPAKYLGKEVTNLIAKIDDSSLGDVTIPVTANIGGMYSSPTVSTDLTSGVKTLTAKLVEIEKQKLIGKGTEKAKDLLSNMINKNSKDSTAASNNNKTATAVLGGLLGKKDTTATTAKDSTASTQKKEAVKEAAKGILGGLLNKKKKDTVN